MATSKLIGGSALKARLDALAKIPPNFAGTWADDTKTRVEHTHPPARRAASRRFTTRITAARAGVYGAYWWIFVDRGTKAHVITGSGRKNPPNFLKFQAGGQTIFAKKVRHPRSARRPFITRAAQEALSASGFRDLVIQTWNRRKLRGRTRFI